MTEPRRCPRNAAANTIETNDADANAMERLAALISRVSCALIHVAQILGELPEPVCNALGRSTPDELDQRSDGRYLENDLAMSTLP